MKRFLEGINLFLGYLSGLGILLMGLLLFYEVILRYFFHAPTMWSQEIAIYLFTWAMLGGASYTLMKKKHVRIDLFVEHLSEVWQRRLECLTSIVGTCFCAVVTWQGYEMVQLSLKFNRLSATPLRVPQWIPQMALLLGFALLTLQFVLLVIDTAGSFAPKRREGRELS